MKNIADNLQTLQKQEAEFARTHKSDTDDELIVYLVKCSKELGWCPKKENVIWYKWYLCENSNWNFDGRKRKWTVLIKNVDDSACSESEKNKKTEQRIIWFFYNDMIQ